MPIVQNDIYLIALMAFGIDDKRSFGLIAMWQMLLKHFEPVRLGAITLGNGMINNRSAGNQPGAQLGL